MPIAVNMKPAANPVRTPSFLASPTLFRFPAPKFAESSGCTA